MDQAKVELSFFPFGLRRDIQAADGAGASSIRLRPATPTTASAFWPEKLRALRQGPMIALYGPIAVSTRARRP